MKRPAQINDLLDRIKQDYPEHYNYAIAEFGGRSALAGMLFLQFACIDYVDNSKDKPQEQSKELQELTLAYDQLDEIAKHLNAVPGEDLTADDLHDGVDTIAKACIRKIDKLIPNGDRLGELIYEVTGIANMSPGQAHHIGKRLYAKIKEQ